MTRNKKLFIGMLPFLALIVLLAIFCGIVSAKGYRLDMYMKIIFNEGIVLSIVATGAIFIYTLGSFDISLGAATLFSATIGVVTYNATESIVLMIAVIMLTGIGCSLLNSVLASIFHIPVFVTTVAMMSVLSAVASQIITTKGGAVGGISIPSEVVKGLDTSGFKILVLVVWVFLAGIGVGIGAFMTLVYTPSVTTTTAGDIGMNIMVAIVFGGMPISGGARSKIYAAVVGGFSYIVLNNILDLLIESTSGYGITQIISAVFFLVVVYVASVNYRSEMLPR